MTPPRIPRATYRLQLNREFGFRAAAAVVPYLHALGISHVYCSPYLKARAGSHHGYDIVDHNTLNPELGDLIDYQRLVQALAQHGMGQILDLVPNHMGIGGDDNPWWLDVLENGPASSYADYFDIDWQATKPQLAARVLLPFLEDHYGKVLANGRLRLDFDAGHGEFSIRYYEHRCPLDPRSYPRVLREAVAALAGELGAAHPEVRSAQDLLAALEDLPPHWQLGAESRLKRHRDKEVGKQRLTALCQVSPALRLNIDTAVARFNGRAGDPASFDDLHELLEQQAYRLAYWRVAADEINYRRFFDINDLAGLRMERPEVFAATHRRVLALIASGQLHGLRIDHPDGLYDPADYYARLEQAVAAALERSEALPLYVIVEKILAPGETLPAGWRVHGTTGYDFASQLNGLFVHPDGEQPLSRLYARLLGSEPRFVDEVYAGKKIVMRTLMAGELQVLAGLLDRLSESDRDTRDYTLPTLRDALLEYVACLPVYRTYISAGGATDADRQFAARALRQARRRSPAGGESVYGFLEQLLLGHGSGATPRPELAHFLMKLQQYSAPVMAKGLEDTALYRYCRLTSLNEVGTDPRLFGLSLDAFHRASHERARHWPHSLLATSTHDTKRSEDVRARIHVLSELTQPWTALVQRWVRRHRHLKRDVDDAPAPAANDEYLLYQTLVGIWPYGQVDDAALTSLRDRVAAYLRKAVREAKVHSGWLNPNAAYEGAVDAFGSALLGSRAGNRFLDDFLPFQRQVARLGALNSLAQSLIKLTAPGVPDIYQGNELFDFSLVDPDNRRPVDYERRQTLLAELRLLPELAPAARAAAVRAMLDDDPPDRAKLYLIWTVLTRRAAEPELFRDGDYRPLAVRGPLAAHVCAYARTTGARRAVTVAARWFNRLLSDAAGTMPEPAAWGSTEIGLPPADTPYVDALTGRDHYPRPDGTGAWLPLTEVLADFPVTLLMTGPQAGRQ